MLRRIVIGIFPILLTLSARSQQSPTGAALPGPEEFINSIDTTVMPKDVKQYYLMTGADSCLFVKYDYDRWIQYVLKEPLSINVLNELAGKVYLSRYPYIWHQPKLNKAVCINGRQADSLIRKGNVIFTASLPQFTDNGQYAVIDFNFHCGSLCGRGTTYVFRLTTTGEWRLIGQYVNWSS
ncbi:MAG TPA: hypothetical protein VHE34_29460 [Puia sp.]|uniref:hypothetical protein n=1 Tax=Puia sp. TaxID=2045100 RepID=UPI002C5C9CDC|nr:hypothetical protein [Puia sp.]HVU99399.1 hypothetical protein [Puia sp.]